METEFNTLQELLTCPLCRETIVDPAILACGHLYCYDCICFGIEFGIKNQEGSASPQPGAPPSHLDDVPTTTTKAEPSPGKKRSRTMKFMCPICEQPAFKWTVTKVPQLEHFLETLRAALNTTTPTN